MTHPDRRRILTAFGGIAAAASAPWPAFAAEEEALTRTILAVEAKIGGRLGVVIKEVGSRRSWSHRAKHRFPMCSVFKAIAGAAVLARVDADEEQLSRLIPIRPADLLTYSPVTKAHVGGSMSLGELCAAAIETSDNTAGNLVLESIGGPAGFTRFVHSIGDVVTRLDRMEPELNESTPGDPRDTSSPQALVNSFTELLLGDALRPASRQKLTEWMEANKVGAAKVRAGLPKGWRVADKTGAGGYGTNNDVGVIWTPRGAAIGFAILMTDTKASVEVKNAGMAEIARSLVAVLND